MNSKIIKKVIPFVILLATIATFSSCNRGMGCPNNFSLDTVISVVDNVSSAVNRIGKI